MDGTINSAGTLSHFVKIKLIIDGRERNERLFILALGKQKIILGTPWLKRENLIIDWVNKTISWQTDTPLPQPTIKEADDDEPTTISTVNPTFGMALLLGPDEIKILREDEDDILIQYFGMDASLEDIWINAKTSHSQTLAQEHAPEKEIPIRERIPKEFHEFLSVFDEKVAS